MKRDLNLVSGEYNPNSVTSIENDLILNWYPHRVIRRSGHVERLLELGLGHGHTAKIFNEHSDSYTVLDGSSVVIKQFKANNPDFTGCVVESYFEDFQSDENYDVIVMGFILEHVDDPHLILEKYRNMLKSNGRLYIAVPNAKSLNRRFGLALGIIDDIYSLNENDLALGHLRQYCLDTLTQAVTHAGYKVTYQEGIYLKPLPLSTLKTLDNFDDNLQAMLKVGVDFPELCVGIMLELTII
ncbi:class I SAM-dependent methyltransferase [Aeromonas veronii]